MKVNACSKGLLGIAAATLIAAPTAHGYPGDPAGTNCESNALGALYCDGPVQPDGSWTRCVDVSPQPVYGGPQGQWNGMTSPYHQCYHYDPVAPPLKLGQPDHHIGDGL
jgi:hypothetical protein